MRRQDKENDMTANDINEARNRAMNVRAGLQSDRPPLEVRVYNLATNVLDLCDEVQRLRAELDRYRR